MGAWGDFCPPPPKKKRRKTREKKNHFHIIQYNSMSKKSDQFLYILKKYTNGQTSWAHSSGAKVSLKEMVK